VIKVTILLGGVVVLSVNAYAHVSLHLLTHKIPANVSLTVLFVSIAAGSILVIDAFDNRRRRREGQPATETRQTLVDVWGYLTTLWRVKNLFYVSLLVLSFVAFAPQFYTWITNPNNASAVNALGTGILAFLTGLYVALTGYLVRGNNRALRAQTEPTVVVYDTSPGENGSNCPALVVQNMGPVTARDVRLRARLPDDRLSAYLGVLSTSPGLIRVGSLLPHERAVLPLRSVPTGLLRREKPYTYTVTATWTGGPVADDSSGPTSRTFSLAVRSDATDRDNAFEGAASDMDTGMDALVGSIRDGHQATAAQMAAALHDLASAIRDDRALRVSAVTSGISPARYRTPTMIDRIIRGMTRHSM